MSEHFNSGKLHAYKLFFTEVTGQELISPNVSAADGCFCGGCGHMVQSNSWRGTSSGIQPAAGQTSVFND